MTYRFAIISSGELLLVDSQGNSTEVVSKFIADAEKREEKTNRLNAWKDETQAWQPGMMTPEWSSLNPANRIERRKMLFSNVAADRGNISYSIAMPGGGGLFRYDIGSSSESRLVHRNDFYPQGLSARASDGLLVFSSPDLGGTANIFVGKRDGVQHVKLTTGDSRDESPVWVNSQGKDFVYFHSIGLGRNQAGYLVGFAPATLCRLDYEGGEVETLVKSKQFDYLQPRVNDQGELFCIRRPYEARGPRPPSPLQLAKDILLFPLRLARAAYYFANFISVMFSGKNLADSHRNPAQPTITRELVLWGRALDTQKQLRKTPDGRLAVAPKDWELVKVDSRQGSADVLVTGVLCFDVTSSGGLVYSDGSGVYERNGNEDRQIGDRKGVVQVAAL